METYQLMKRNLYINVKYAVNKMSDD